MSKGLDGFIIEHFGTLFTIFSSIFGVFATAVWWVIRKAFNIQNSVVDLYEKVGLNKDSIESIHKKLENSEKSQMESLDRMARMETKIDILLERDSKRS